MFLTLINRLETKRSCRATQFRVLKKDAPLFVEPAQSLLEGFFADAKLLPNCVGRTVIVEGQAAAIAFKGLDDLILRGPPFCILTRRASDQSFHWDGRRGTKPFTFWPGGGGRRGCHGKANHDAHSRRWRCNQGSPAMMMRLTGCPSR